MTIVSRIISMEYIIKNLEYYRKKKKLTKKELMKKMGIPETYIYRWRRGQGPSLLAKRLITNFLVNNK